MIRVGYNNMNESIRNFTKREFSKFAGMYETMPSGKKPQLLKLDKRGFLILGSDDNSGKDNVTISYIITNDGKLQGGCSCYYAVVSEAEGLNILQKAEELQKPSYRLFHLIDIGFPKKYNETYLRL